MGKLHLEIMKNRLLRDFNLKVKVHKPRVSYRETDRAGRSKSSASATAIIGGQNLFAKVQDPPGAVRQAARSSRSATSAARPSCRGEYLDATLEAAGRAAATAAASSASR